MRSHRLRVLVVAAIVTAGIACYEGPFAHNNPNDPSAQFTMRLEADRDTISPGDPAVQFTLVTEPAMPGYTPIWQASIDTLIYHVENGRFQLADIPESNTTVQISASFMNRSTSRALVIVP